MQPDLPNACLKTPLEVAVEEGMWACARQLLCANSCVPAASGGAAEVVLRGVTETLDACDTYTCRAPHAYTLTVRHLLRPTPLATPHALAMVHL